MAFPLYSISHRIFQIFFIKSRQLFYPAHITFLKFKFISIANTLKELNELYNLIPTCIQNHLLNYFKTFYFLTIVFNCYMIFTQPVDHYFHFY